VLAGNDGAGERSKLKADLTLILNRRQGYNARNFPPGMLGGYARIDAFGAILNEVFTAPSTTGTPPRPR
jgi:hypothetical protein